MPLLHVTLTPGAFDDAGKIRLVEALTEAACRAESVPNEPVPRSRAIVLLQEADAIYMATLPAEGRVRGIFARWNLSTGIVDAARKARFAQDLQAAAEAAAGESDGRRVVTSCVIDEVPEGQWAQSGRIARLPDITGDSRFEHLTAALLTT